MPSGRRQALLVALVGGLLLAATGCASMPDAGQVREVSAVPPKGQEDPHVRVFALPPQDKEEPVDIVNGFLEALTSDEAGFDTARKYLTPQAQQTWRPDAETVIFESRTRFPLTQVSQDSVRLAAAEVARVDPAGLYQPTEPDRLFDVKFQLAQVNGQWRIASLPSGVYVSEFDFQRLYKPLNLYFFDPGQRVLVPDPVYVPSRPGQVTAVVRTLLRGPSMLLGPAVISAFPPDTRLVGDQVTVRGGVPQVRLNNAVLASSPQAREAMSAQLVWTLAQLGYDDVRIAAEGGDFDQDRAAEPHGKQQYARYDPGAEPSAPTGYFEQGGKLIRILGKPPAGVPGPFGTGKLGARSFAVSLGNDQVAAVAGNGRLLYVGGMFEGDTAKLRLSGQSSLARPSWDGAGRIWAVDRSPAESRVWMIPPQGDPQRVQAPDLETARVRDLRVAPDGTRVAVLVESAGKAKLWVGRVERGPVAAGAKPPGGQLTISGIRQIAGQLQDVRTVSWSGRNELTVLGEDSEQVWTPHQVNFDGSGLKAGESGPGRELDAVASAGERHPLLAATNDGVVWQLPGNGQWINWGKGRMPIYPG